MSAGDVRLAELLAALSVATDLGMGQEPEKAVRACLVASAIARALDLPERDVRDVYYGTLLLHLGCTAPAHETTRLFGDDLTMLPVAERGDARDLREVLALMAVAGKGTGVRRIQHLARTVGAGEEGGRRIQRAVCEVGARLAERLHLGAAVAEGLFHSTESWDGKDSAHGLAGEAIALPARVGLVAMQAVIFDRLGGPELAAQVVRRRAGAMFDPDVAGAFARVGSDVLRRLADADVWVEVLDAEPSPPRMVPAAHIDAVAAAFGDMADLKTPYTLGHATEVADLSVRAGERLGLGEPAVRDLRHAGLLHDVGRVAVPNAVWERAGRLTTAQWEQVRLHAYHSERILVRSQALKGVATLAGCHHERHDGSGYHRGASGPELPVEARLLAVADAFQAMTQPRPHRPARPPEEVARIVDADAASGRFDPECAAAVIEAAGQSAPRRGTAWPAGLTQREVEVLRLVAQGSSNREVAAALTVSRRTAEHHVQHIYAKIGVSTRAAAALFAMEHGLLR